MRDNLSGEKLFEALGNLDDDILEEALAVKNKKKLTAAKNKEPVKIIFLHPVFKGVVAVCVSLAIIALTVFGAIKLNLSDFGLVSSTPQQNTSTPGPNYSSVPPDESSDVDGSEPDHHSPTGNIKISSIDMLNYYSAKKVLMEDSLLPVSMPMSLSSNGAVIKLTDGNVRYYEIDRHTTFTITMITYFTINLLNENGFLAQKLGGTGLVEVVYTENNLENMITFKKGDKYYSCLCTGASYNTDSTNSIKSARFSSHKYIEGFNIVKNKEQENYEFTVYFENQRVTGMNCSRFQDNSYTHEADPDYITMAEDYCVVMFVKRQFTIDQLEAYFGKEKDQEEII